MPSSDVVAFVLFVFLPTSSSEAVAALRLLDDDEAIVTTAALLIAKLFGPKGGCAQTC